MVRMHLVTWDNRKRYRKVLERYFRIRYEIYVKQRRWRDVARPINIEIDAFDNEHTLYVLALDTNGKIVGGSRLLPTLEPHLMSEVFPGLAGGRPPRAAGIFEWTRFFVVPSLRTQGAPSPIAGIVLCGLLETAQSLGIRQISVVCETFWPKRLRALGWTLIELGEALEHPDGDIIALLIDVTPEAVEQTRRAYGISGVILADNI
ncbi:MULTISPECIES: acyl-homoserine-lactone synthase [unclassified Mesorhizobium]|uniref:acyl-homoserine-lactone synthase n=1 Tax=unclassified Mesorhizobium TaxID=325217 RepID=UPI0010929E1C|nr:MULTISPECIES: acyl-homoserine-lactone synthase [unclassified Mesorhizobium]TGU40033.1 GNAT family N-acetyltransferase [bacterium M00.F.Ca.ET.156.01.1.1]TGV15179.1 GNAT family N-acetyltransferase [Mesorhizobium sp. M8A.F.Ca.ET.173.01.1.1]TGQ77315.1 GNAT family N-acetyltransferase [Mesorhizobium sp. M8A.F.Ca.ET.207.01.1.1]TGQ89051.1 GNAT family N-acetyltransferase [Mesorhizobium sp. M8A.F.Ca.ET.208.01.1.1]TGR32156.1 GNAT family N-acetyltransferase [Mesorhizobium sp. M8A.F.Ca.ET.202.01.1.1]